MDVHLHQFAQHIINVHTANTVEQKLAYLKLARDYVTTYGPVIDAVVFNTVLGLQVFGHLVLFQELLLLIEAVLSRQPNVELILPMLDFIERVGYQSGDDWMLSLLESCGRMFPAMLPHILNGRTSPQSTSWRLCWQRMSCLGQSMGVKAITSSTTELQLAGIIFIEGLVLMYTDASILATAENCRGGPTVDMLLFNSRYLLDQIVEVLSGSESIGRTPIRAVESLVRIVFQRETYFDLLVPSLLRLTNSSQYKWTSDPETTEAEKGMNSTLKQSILTLMKGRISMRQKSMLLLGLGQLGSRQDAYYLGPASDDLLGNASWGYAHEGTEAQQAKRAKIEPHQLRLPSSVSPSSGPAFGTLKEKAKRLFQGRLSISEMCDILDGLLQSGHADCLDRAIDELNPELTTGIVLHVFTHSPILQPAEKKQIASKAEIKKEPEDVEMPDVTPTVDVSVGGLQPSDLSLGERQMLIEYVTGQLLKRDTTEKNILPFGLTLLSKLASRSHASDIPMQLLTDFITNKLSTKQETVHELMVQFLFDLYAVYGSSPCMIDDLRTILEMPFDPVDLKHPYDQTLYVILDGIQGSEIEGKDKILKRLLLDVPVLPPVIAFHFFRRLLGHPSKAVAFLITANALMDSHPILKPVLLECILDTCTGEDAETREKGIRLVKNKLHQDQDLAPRIERFALDALDRLVHLQPNEIESPGRLSHLYLALCTRKATLLRHLLEAYGRSSEEGKKIIQESAKQLSEAVNFLLPELLTLIEEVPEGSETLLLLLLSIFPGSKAPPQKVIDACLARYQSSKNVRYLLPVMPALSKEHVLDIIPSLTQLPLTEFASAVAELVKHLPFGEPCVEPSEVLVALGSRSEVHGEFSSVRSALDYCIKEMSEVFDKEVLAGALNKLTHMHTLPVLFMRMVLLSIGREKELETFVLQTVLSPSVIASKIWTEKSQWQGYLLLLQRTQPSSFCHLLTLTTKLMMSAVRELPRSYAQQFLEFVESESCDVRVPNDALEALKECAMMEQPTDQKSLLIEEPPPDTMDVENNDN